MIDAVNADMPYDRFVKLQLAADLMPGTPRDDLRALGYLGAAPIYHKDLRLSEDVIDGFMTDDWDERVDAVSRGLLGLTVGCARCHDHKFDPIHHQGLLRPAGRLRVHRAAPSGRWSRSTPRSSSTSCGCSDRLFDSPTPSTC